MPASLVIGQSGGGPAALVRFLNNDQGWQNITINGSGRLDLNNFDEYAADVTLNCGGDVQTGTGALYVVGANGLTVNPASNNPATITGRLGFNAGSRPINVAAGTTMRMVGGPLRTSDQFVGHHCGRHVSVRSTPRPGPFVCCRAGASSPTRPHPPDTPQGLRIKRF